uniref:Interferon induced protein 44 like n=1 Tax=Balaenoptera musculus TaxID=9771 RepID=A0A8C0CXM6_BALMU
MAVRTTLTWNEEKSLQKLLGNVSLILLYKSTVHGNRISNMYNRCIRQGSTVTMIYCPKNSFGIFMLGHYPEISEGFRKLNSSIYFSFQKNKTMEMTAAFLNSTLKISNDQLEFQFPISPVQYLSLDLHKRTIVIPKLLVEKLGLNPDLGFRFLECEVFRVEEVEMEMEREKGHRNSLLADLRAYRPYADLVSEIRILLLGPVGSGKSSFFNSVKSIFHGHLTHQAIVGSDVTSITEQYRIYSVKDGKDGKSLPFMLCDSMGLDEKEGVGLCVADIPHILKGCVPDRYQFSPHKPITPKHPAFITSPSLKDRIHCVAYVFDINSIDNLSSKMVAKFKQVQKEVLNCGDFVILSHVDSLMFIKFIFPQIQNANKMLGIPLSNILVVENYASEREMDPLKDILILSALKQMFRAADDFLEDLPLE